MSVDLDQYKKYEVLGVEYDAAMRNIVKQIDEWGLCLPHSNHLMFHFGLNDFYAIGETEFWVSNEIDAGYCAKLIFVFDKQTCPYHFHKVKHETFYILKGKTAMKVNGEETVKQTGDILVVPTETNHSFTGLGSCLLLEVSMPSIPGDSYFENTDIGDNGVL